METCDIAIETAVGCINSFVEIHRASFFLLNIWRLLSLWPCILQATESLKMIMLFVNIVRNILLRNTMGASNVAFKGLSLGVEWRKFSKV